MIRQRVERIEGALLREPGWWTADQRPWEPEKTSLPVGQPGAGWMKRNQ